MVPIVAILRAMGVPDLKDGVSSLAAHTLNG
jgi:hypothetical protein